jgi:hypothetical protein
MKQSFAWGSDARNPFSGEETAFQHGYNGGARWSMGGRPSRPEVAKDVRDLDRPP